MQIAARASSAFIRHGKAVHEQPKEVEVNGMDQQAHQRRMAIGRRSEGAIAADEAD